MVSGDVVMELLPEMLDDVVIQRVRRQKVQHDASAERLVTLLDAACHTDEVVIQHQINTPRAPLSTAQVVQELSKDLSGLLLGNAVNDAPRACVQHTEDVPFNVLPRREHHGLLPALEIGRPNLRGQMKVAFVPVEYLLLKRGAGDKFLTVFQYLSSPASRNAKSRPRPSTPTPPTALEPKHVSAGELHAGVGLHSKRQQLQRPVHSVPVVLLWNVIQITQQAGSSTCGVSLEGYPRNPVEPR